MPKLASGSLPVWSRVTSLMPYSNGLSATPTTQPARWRFRLEPAKSGVNLTFWAQIGPARSGLSRAIDAMPDKEERIVARRLDEHRANMVKTIEGIKALAEE